MRCFYSTGGMRPEEMGSKPGDDLRLPRFRIHGIVASRSRANRVAGFPPANRPHPFVNPRLLRLPLLLCAAAHFAQARPAEKPDPNWWSLQPLKAVAAPPVPAGGRNEIDAFLTARLKTDSLTFSPEAPRAVLR